MGKETKILFCSLEGSSGVVYRVWACMVEVQKPGAILELAMPLSLGIVAVFNLSSSNQCTGAGGWSVRE